MGASNDELVMRAIDGERAALTALLQLHAEAVRASIAGTIARRWRSVLSEDDVLQQTCMEAYLDVSRFQLRDEASFVAWLKKLARTNLLDAVRMLEARQRGGDRQRVEAALDTDSGAILLGLLTGSSSAPSRVAAKSENRQIINAALRKLPTPYRRVIRLYDLDGRPVAEVARTLETSVGGVYMLRARAHDRLREILGSASKYLSGSA